ncbi:hypothetical protein EVAR_67966_1 [Eumeta japonica]|uniref:Uncharacterized protein n=1 Tax=Eumeta variegata TaxID=151549 RepID=A0A4C2A285_EUMVA|nr:hypothetical protein EVAR_67966_1 [Eumeta japonica]
MKTPKSSTENVHEDDDKLAVMVEILKTPESSKINDEAPSSSMKGVKELLKTPKSLSTPHFEGVRELMKTPKVRETPNTTGIKDLLETPVPQTCEDIQVVSVEAEDTRETLLEDIPSSSTQPKGCSTPHRKLRVNQ